MEETNGKSTLLYNLSSIGEKIDKVYLTEVPNCDNSGVEYLIEFLEDFDDDLRIPIGHCELIMGNICLDKVGEKAEIIGISYSAMRLVVDWIEKHH